MKTFLKAGIPALITSLISLALSCLTLLIDFATNQKWFETHIKKYSTISSIFLFCSGFVIILTIILAKFIAKRFMDRKTLFIYLLFISLFYSLMMLTLFPLLSDLNIMRHYMPSSELAPSVSIFVNQWLSIISAVLCAIVSGVKYKISK